MKRVQYVLLGAVGLSGALIGWLELFRRSRESRCVILQEMVPGGPEGLFDRLCEVEAEPELIPGVFSVAVLERGSSSVLYRVEGRTLGVPWWAVFRKEWERAPPTLSWESEDGTFQLRQVGQVDVKHGEAGTQITLVACTHFDAPVLGPIATLTCGPLYLGSAFRSWLRNAGRDGETRPRHQPLLRVSGGAAGEV